MEYQKLYIFIAYSEQEAAMKDQEILWNFEREVFYRHTTTIPDKDAFDAHTHNLCELIYFVRGDATHITEDRKYKLTRGDLVLVRPRRYHFLRIDSDREYERHNILFNQELLSIPNADRVMEQHEVVSLADAPMTAMIFSKMAHWQESMPQAEFEIALRVLLSELFYDLSLMPSDEVRCYSTLHPILSRALAYINENLFTVRDVAEVANALFVAESYLFRLFRTKLKTSPKKYITDKRLLAAQNLIRLGGKPSEVYLSCGFSDYTAFWRSYKRAFGTNPSSRG